MLQKRFEGRRRSRKVVGTLTALGRDSAELEGEFAVVVVDSFVLHYWRQLVRPLLTVREDIVGLADLREPCSGGHHVCGVSHRVEPRRQHLKLGLNLLGGRSPWQLKRLVVALLLDE